MKILIYGSREFGQVVRSLVGDAGHEFAGFIDDFEADADAGTRIIGDWNRVAGEFLPSDFGIAIAVGYANLDARWNVYRKVCDAGYHCPALIHPQAYVAKSAVVGTGSIVMARAIVDCRASLAELTVVWPGTVVNHDSAIGPNVFLSPNSTICGCATVGCNSFVGAGAVVVDHVNVPARSFIKAAGLCRGLDSECRSDR